MTIDASDPASSPYMLTARGSANIRVLDRQVDWATTPRCGFPFTNSGVSRTVSRIAARRITTAVSASFVFV